MPSSLDPDRAGRRPTLTTAAWVVSLPLAGLAGARLAGYDDNAVLVAANGATPLVFLPAYGALAAGILGRRRGLSAVAASLVLAHVVWVAPELRGTTGGQSQGGSRAEGPKLRVVTANIRHGNRRPTELGRELAAWEGDVLFLQELIPDHLIPLKEAGAFDRYPYSYVDARNGSFGGGIWSRFPLSEAETWAVSGHPVARAVADVDGHPVRLFNVHAKAPSRKWAIPLWKEQLAVLGEGAKADPRPVVIAGDFNATYGHKPFRNLLATGLREAHMEVGRGLARTWPRGGRIIPPVYRLDHVLVSPGLAVLDVREGRGKGSDHRPVIADLALRLPPEES
jgi:endonuclease/exonuclease/phosphatase (EEP) superfamily protein YafD